MIQPEKVDVWGLPFSHVTMEQTVDWIDELVQQRTPQYIITANLNYVMLVEQDPELREITEGAIGVLADGQPIVAKSKRTIGPGLPERVTGSELIYQLAANSAKRGWSIYFLGGAPTVADQCARNLESQFPGMHIAGVESPPFRELTADEEQQQHERIRAANPDLLLVAFGQPKGEKWIAKHHRALGVPVSIQLGASFDFVAGTAKRAPAGWQHCGMEWAYRMLSEPRRLVPRYARNAAFLCQLLAKDFAGSWGHSVRG